MSHTKKFGKCPKCGKKGLYHHTSHIYKGVECRYCNYHKATHRWFIDGANSRWVPIASVQQSRQSVAPKKSGINR